MGMANGDGGNGGQKCQTWELVSPLFGIKARTATTKSHRQVIYFLSFFFFFLGEWGDG